ncbi:hypothetical protein BEK98_27760 [Streptomyces diastatochromogenes]|uniref:PatG C-terminal domain-containing protein n=1 Tax=Streptomyces diastatochromogenes TaxID=42236 RepID=A0A233S924_STRDA|nr:hypothetical protein BEK98_27760 [Streptomyces diastatochromogenes]
MSFRFPDVGVEREFAQSIGRTDAAPRTDREALYETLTRSENRYLVRQLCFVFNVQGMETYILEPSDSHSYGLLAEEAIRSNPKTTDLDVVIGRRGPLSAPEACNGLTLPTVRLAQLYSFDRDELVHSIQRPDSVAEEGFEATAKEVLDRVLRMTDNTGAMPQHRAMNYLAVRYPVIYQQTFRKHADNASLTSIEVQRSDVSENRTVMDAIFTYMDRATFLTTKYGVRADVHNMFPFVVSPLSPV